MSNAYTQNNHNFSTVQNIPAINFPVKSFPVKTLAKSDQNGRVTTGIFSTNKVYILLRSQHVQISKYRIKIFD